MDATPTSSTQPQPTHQTHLVKAQTKSRGFNKSTPLGKVMAARGVTAKWVSEQSGVYTRTLTEYLAGRQAIPAHHLAALSATLQVPRSALVNPPTQTPTQTPTQPEDGNDAP